MESYYGVTVTGFPNFFRLVGPNSGLGHNSIAFMIEAHVADVLSAIKSLKQNNRRSFNLRAKVSRAFSGGIQIALSKTLWNSACRSYYFDHNGRNTTLWPGFTWTFRQLTRRFNCADCELD